MRAMTDAELIARVGGPTRLAVLLGIDGEKGAVQRVSNWRTRGIPPRVRLEHARVFAQIDAEGAPPVPAEQPQEAA